MVLRTIPSMARSTAGSTEADGLTTLHSAVVVLKDVQLGQESNHVLSAQFALRLRHAFGHRPCIAVINADSLQLYTSMDADKSTTQQQHQQHGVKRTIRKIGHGVQGLVRPRSHQQVIEAASESRSGDEGARSADEAASIASEDSQADDDRIFAFGVTLTQVLGVQQEGAHVKVRWSIADQLLARAHIIALCRIRMHLPSSSRWNSVDSYWTTSDNYP